MSIPGLFSSILIFLGKSISKYEHSLWLDWNQGPLALGETTLPTLSSSLATIYWGDSWITCTISGSVTIGKLVTRDTNVPQFFIICNWDLNSWPLLHESPTTTTCVGKFYSEFSNWWSSRILLFIPGIHLVLVTLNTFFSVITNVYSFILLL